MRYLLTAAFCLVSCLAVSGELTIACPKCDGKGKDYSSPRKEPCPACKGLCQVRATEDEYRAYRLKVWLKQTEEALAFRRIDLKVAQDRADVRRAEELKAEIADLEAQLAAAKGEPETPERRVKRLEIELKAAEERVKKLKLELRASGDQHAR